MPNVLRKISRLVRYRKFEAALITPVRRPLVRAFRKLRLRRRLRCCAKQPTPPVLVYTMAKVASTAVTEALQSIEGLNVFQIHVISSASRQRLRERMRRRGLIGVRQDVAALEDLGQVIEEEIVKPGRPAKIITLVREPIARNVSFYFQSLDVLWQTENAHERIDLERLLDGYHDRFTHDVALEWFDREFKPTLGIDVYAHPFPHDAGYIRIDSGPYEVLIMRHDLEDRLKEKLLADFIGVGGVSLAPKNVGAQKPYACAYREFISRVKLPEDYVNRLLDSKYARHFYSPEELARLRAKWLKGKAAETAHPSPSVSLAGSAG